MSTRLVELDDAHRDAWSAYVDQHPSATLFHTLDWLKVLVETFAHRPRYLLALREEKVVGVLPLVAIRSIFFGRSVVSVPFGVYGGILADDAEATDTLVEGGRALAVETGAKYVELRHLEAPPGLELPESELHCTFIRDLPDDSEDVLGLFPRKARAEVRKAAKREGITSDVAPLDLLEFHGLFADNKRRLGSPVFPRSLFWHLQDVLGDRCRVLTIRQDGRPLAAVMCFVFKDQLMAYYSGAVVDANRFSANNLMYARAMEWATEQGLKRFDFGRSRKDTGAYAFKHNQGFEARPLHYGFLVPDGAPLPQVNMSNPRYDLARKVFRRMPGFMAEKLGSFVVKRTPV